MDWGAEACLPPRQTSTASSAKIPSSETADQTRRPGCCCFGEPAASRQPSTSPPGHPPEGPAPGPAAPMLPFCRRSGQQGPPRLPRPVVPPPPPAHQWQSRRSRRTPRRLLPAPVGNQRLGLTPQLLALGQQPGQLSPQRFFFGCADLPHQLPTEKPRLKEALFLHPGADQGHGIVQGKQGVGCTGRHRRAKAQKRVFNTA